MSQANKLAMALLQERVGAVVVFKEGTTEDEARIALSRLEKVDLKCIDGPHTFDPETGGPAWYIP